ncbi:unnamed protein product [Trifolium pratense]|uniref:Uncharacterized protein n=1 Tax=Trifolium pratense TaxID=57577 RepID=A0ACB0L5V0_TRIPR|nr:unnamed protein product [Trifolium pratense]
MERRTSQVSLRENQEVEKRIQPRQGLSGYVFMVELSVRNAINKHQNKIHLKAPPPKPKDTNPTPKLPLDRC